VVRISGLRLEALNPVIVAGYIEILDRKRSYSKPSVKQHLAAIRMLFDYLVTGGVLLMNPASSVRGPKYSIRRGKTSVLAAEEARQLLDSIETDTIIGLRDRALIGVMVYSFGRVSAVITMRVEDFFQSGKRWKFRFMEKGGKDNEVFAHHNAEAYLDATLMLRGSGRRRKLHSSALTGRSSSQTGSSTARILCLSQTSISLDHGGCQKARSDSPSPC
jgi:site-specific recombinase XerC